MPKISKRQKRRTKTVKRKKSFKRTQRGGNKFGTSLHKSSKKHKTWLDKIKTQLRKKKAVVQPERKYSDPFSDKHAVASSHLKKAHRVPVRTAKVHANPFGDQYKSNISKAQKIRITSRKATKV